MTLDLYVSKSVLAGFSKIVISSERENEPASPATIDAIVSLLDTLKEQSAPTKLHPKSVIDLYNEYATKHGWVRVMKQTPDLRAKVSTAIKNLGTLEEWVVVMTGLRDDPYFSGSASEYKTNIQTLIFKQRYMTFYDASMSRGEQAPKLTIKEITDEFDALMATVKVAPFPHLQKGTEQC